jgi:hypothetical protein
MDLQGDCFMQRSYHYQPGLKRYRCQEQACKRTCNDLTGTLLDGSKRSVMVDGNQLCSW